MFQKNLPKKEVLGELAQLPRWLKAFRSALGAGRGVMFSCFHTGPTIERHPRNSDITKI